MRCQALIIVALLSPLLHAQAASLEDEIQGITDGILTGEDREFLPAEAAVEEIVTQFYEERDYRPAWQDKKVAKQVLDLIANSAEHGLHPVDYHYQELLGLIDEWDKQLLKSNRTLAQFDVLLTDAMLLYARHLIEGKVNPGPMEYSWNYSRRKFLPDNVIEEVNRAIDEGRVGEALSDLAPDSWFYLQLKAALSFYRGLEQRGASLPMSTGEILHAGDRHTNVAELRQRLLELGFIDGRVEDAEYFDSELESATREFQTMRGLRADGIAGAGTFAALNVPYAKRIEQIRINMDRIRWVQEDVSDNFLVVNIAGFELYYIKNKELVWNTDVMVGTVAHQTPMFRARIKYLVFNPDWTVPRSIIRRSLYPRFSADPNSIADSNYKLYDAAGVEVLPADLDWSQLSRNHFPFRVVQQPGPDNALGRVKFMFPNKHAIYLHDTPNRELFDRTARAFSAGCIRVQHPLQLAETLLADPDLWQREQIDQVLAAGQLKVVHLAVPVDVLLMYWTASPTPAGRVKFHPDVYRRDAGVLASLNAPPSWENQ